MKAVLSFIMRGRMQAVMAAVLLAVLALLITPLSIFSAAVIALVVLRQGIYEGLIVFAMGIVAMALFGILLFGLPLVLAGMGLMLWLPLLALASVLRLGRSLGLAIEITTVFAMLLVLAQYLITDDPSQFWAAQMGEFFGQVLDADLMSKQDIDLLVAQMARWMAGALALTWLIQVSLSLFLARSWQALLYNPGGFAKEFQNLALGKWLLILVPFLLVAGLLGKEEPNVMAHMLLVGMGVFFFQGVALVHGLVAKRKMAKSWLVGFYFVLFVGMPPSFTLISAAGYADGWLNFRRRLGSSDKEPNVRDDE